MFLLKAMLKVNENMFSGDLDAFCFDGLDVLDADCLGPDEEVTCTCCTRCCDRQNSCQNIQ